MRFGIIHLHVLRQLLLKFSIFYLLRKYRLFYGNLRNVVILGNGKSVEELAYFFNDNPDYGYNLMKIF